MGSPGFYLSTYPLFSSVLSGFFLGAFGSPATTTEPVPAELEDEVAELEESLSRLGYEPTQLREWGREVEENTVGEVYSPGEDSAVPEGFVELVSPTVSRFF